MPREFTVGHRLGRFLQFENLEVDALALVGDDEERVDWALWSAGLLPKIKTIGVSDIHQTASRLP